MEKTTVLENVYSGLLENADTDARQRTPDNPRRTTDAGQTMEKTDKRWKRRTNDGKDGQRLKRRTTMEKTENDGKDGQQWMDNDQMSVYVIFTAKNSKYVKLSPS